MLESSVATHHMTTNSIGNARTSINSDLRALRNVMVQSGRGVQSE